MRRLCLVLACLLAGDATAAPAHPPRTPPPAAPTWADWVGDYTGKLVWANCITPGERSAKLALDGSDGVMTLNLSPAGGGLRAITLVEDEQGFSAQDGDITARVTHPRADSLALAVTLDSGCSLHAQLKRPATVAACDRLVGWTRLEALCSRLPGSHMEDLATVARTKWRKADAKTCAARADKLQLELVDAGCAPHPDPTIGTRGKECQALAAMAARFDRCQAVSTALRDVLMRKAYELSAASQTADRSTLPVVEAQCAEARDTIVMVAARTACPL